MYRLRKKPPYPQDGEKSPIHILIYHSGTDPPEVGQVLQRNVNAQRNFGQVQTLITPDGNMYVGIATIFVVTCMAVYLHKREYSETNCNIV
ncbi:hypothetical protein RhiirB3_409734 [Rhizophagus irregularis]|uniref:Uncharacterized protein n=1 Tax=Rhizophagus irregularis (strain DAOM 181602 / DAOM 197198 / MUCL 43194) TaxID=747089 RepID=U9SJA7_RHIID|nr:hypothetical protein RhiirB3_409734 [Rhizophagus irregularis]